jgi:hypothetical protein
MGNAIPKPTCYSAYRDNQQGCNNADVCYYVDNKCNDKVQFYSLSNIPSNNIKCSIYPDTTKSNNYILYCINQNPNKNIVIKSIQIKNCNTLYRNDCNILIPLNIQNNEFALKPYMQTFSSVNGELTRRLNLTLEQVNLIKSNNNQITLIDIYDFMLTVTVEMYDKNFEQSFSIDKDMLNINIANINKTTVNLKALGLNSKMIS